MTDTAADDLMQYASVRVWLENTPTTSLRPRDEQGRRLELLRQFCATVECDPDTLVTRARADAATKNALLKRLVTWAALLPGSERARHDAENTIRGFFMRNGFRVVARPYRDVYARGQG